MADMINMEIAGVNFAVSSGSKILRDDDPAYKSFFKHNSSASEADIDICLEPGNMPDTEGLTRIFDSGRAWSVFEDGDYYLLSLNPPELDGQPVWIARFKHNFTKISVFCGDMLIDKKKGCTTISNPVRYPLDQLLLMYILSIKGGAVLHAAGMGINNKGYIFPGRSGAGKSTLTRLFAGRVHVELLSDDRIVAVKDDGRFMSYGTPWPGEEGIAANKGAPLSGLFFISHGLQNCIEDIRPQKALERLLPVVSIPWYDRETMARILLFCEDLISNVPSYELHFKPGAGAADVLERFISG